MSGGRWSAAHSSRGEGADPGRESPLSHTSLCQVHCHPVYEVDWQIVAQSCSSDPCIIEDGSIHNLQLKLMISQRQRNAEAAENVCQTSAILPIHW